MHFPGTESSTLEFKESLPNTSKLLQEAVAFANQYGGRIVIGVRDDGTIKGIDESQADQLLLVYQQHVLPGNNSSFFIATCLDVAVC